MFNPTRFPAPAAWGRGLRPHLEPPRLGATTATATVYDLPAVSRRLPRQCADPVGRVRLTGLRLDAWPRCATALRSLPSGPRLRHLDCAKWLRACGLPEQPPRADSLRQTARGKVATGHQRACRQALHAATALPVPSLFLRACLNPDHAAQALPGTSCASAPVSYRTAALTALAPSVRSWAAISQATNSGKDGGSNADGPHATTPDNA